MGKVFFKKITGQFDFHEALLLVFAVAYFMYFTAASFLRYDNYYTGRFDLGNMTQTVWNTIHGNIFMLTNPNSTQEISRLAFHADFILVLLSPFFLLWEDPRMLLLIQTIVLSLGGVFIYLLAKEILKNKTISLVLALCFFLNPAVNFTNLYDFHPVTLATTFFLAAFYFIQKKNYITALILLALAGITKEEVWLINALVGGYLFIFKKERVIGGLLGLTSVILFYVLIWIAIPRSLGSQHFALSYYSDFGDSPAKIIKNIIFSPKKTLQIILMPDRMGYLKQLFLPLGYLSIFGIPFLVFAGPDLLINLLSTNPTLHQIYYQYSSTVTPFIFISAVFGISKIKSKFPEIPYATISIILILLTLASAYNFGPLPFAKKPNINMFEKPLLVRGAVDGYIASLPKSDSVSATNNLGSHLSHRRNIYTLPMGIAKADTIMFLINDSTNENEKKALTKLENDPSYYLVTRDQNFFVFKKRPQ